MSGKQIIDGLRDAVKGNLVRVRIGGFNWLREDYTTPTQDAYDAACKALAHWRKEARRLGRIAKVKPREMNSAKR